MSYLNDYVFNFLKNRLIYHERQYNLSFQKEIYQNLFQYQNCNDFTIVQYHYFVHF